uniref:Uncharacterized protein n=1 Tax=Brassica campestris TaxID=3711 RepID=M4CV18_BRACM
MFAQTSSSRGCGAPSFRSLDINLLVAPLVDCRNRNPVWCMSCVEILSVHVLLVHSPKKGCVRLKISVD